MAKVWTRIRQTIERHGSAALLSVIGAAGSVPRETGARIVLQPDGGFFGTIGGGRLEYEAMARGARDARRRARHGAVPRLAVGSQSRPMLRRHGENAHRDLRRQRSRRGTALRGAEEAGRVRDREPPRRRWTDRARAGAAERRPKHASGRGLRQDVVPRAVRRGDHAGAAVRRRPCRPGRRAGAGAAAVHGPLDRRPAGPVSATCAAKCRHHLHRRPSTRELARGAARRHGHRHDPFASARFRHHRGGAAAGRVRFRRPDRLRDQAGAVRGLGPAGGRRRKRDRPAGLSDRHAADQRQGTRHDCRRDRRATPHRAGARVRAAVSPATQPA